MAEWEAQSRMQTADSWSPEKGGDFPFRADFYLGTGPACAALKDEFVFRDQGEDTCIASISSLHKAQ